MSHVGQHVDIDISHIKCVNVIGIQKFHMSNVTVHLGIEISHVKRDFTFGYRNFTCQMYHDTRI